MRIFVENKYQEYLQKVNLPESRMASAQRIETRRAFYAAFGMALLTLRDEVAEHPEMEGVMIMQDMLDQVNDFYNGNALVPGPTK